MHIESIKKDGEVFGTKLTNNETIFRVLYYTIVESKDIPKDISIKDSSSIDDMHKENIQVTEVVNNNEQDRENNIEILVTRVIMNI